MPFIVCIGEKGRLTKEDLEAAILTQAHRLASAELMELRKINDPTIHVCAWIGTSHRTGYFMPGTASQCGHPFFFSEDRYLCMENTGSTSLAGFPGLMCHSYTNPHRPRLSANRELTTVRVTRGMRKVTLFLGVEGKTEEISHRID